MRRSYYYSFLAIILSTGFISGCSTNNQNPDALAMSLNGKSRFVKDKRFQASSVLNHSPKIIIAKPRERIVTAKKSSGFNFGASMFGGLQDKKGDNDYATNQSLTAGEEAKGATDLIGNPFSNFKKSQSTVLNSSERITKKETKSVPFPVVAVAYGEKTTVVKSIDGGFATLLLRQKQGNRKNLYACDALFKRMFELSNSEIEQSAQSNENLSRPTYWLDKRQQPKGHSRSEVAMANGSMVHLASTGKKGVKAKKRTLPKTSNCTKRLPHYHYTAAASLIKRVGLYDRMGPFLVAWRDDGKKAMIADLSQLETKQDFEAAMSLWVNKIAQKTSLWDEGVIDSAGFQADVAALTRKSGKSSFSLRTPAKETASGN